MKFGDFTSRHNTMRYDNSYGDLFPTMKPLDKNSTIYSV